MRFLGWLALFALLLPLLPERFAWSRGEAGCCGEGCLCAGPELPSCCDERAGPVIVALCGCGEPHGPSLFERAPIPSSLPPPLLALARAQEWEALLESVASMPRSLRIAPEPPPPRRVS